MSLEFIDGRFSREESEPNPHVGSVLCPTHPVPEISMGHPEPGVQDAGGCTGHGAAHGTGSTDIFRE